MWRFLLFNVGAWGARDGRLINPLKTNLKQKNREKQAPDPDRVAGRLPVVKKNLLISTTNVC